VKKISDPIGRKQRIILEEYEKRRNGDNTSENCLKTLNRIDRSKECRNETINYNKWRTIECAINAAKTRKMVGPDKIPAEILELLSTEGRNDYLLQLFNV